MLKPVSSPDVLPNLSPARWIVYPSGRILANTVTLFRRPLTLPSSVKIASGWISADSRYLLFINGQRVQFGPAPCDPRFLEADPLDVSDLLKQGENHLAVQTLYYGHGDGTSPLGKPGFLFSLTVECEDESKQAVVSDRQWQACNPRSWRAGMYKRSYVRAFQEIFDARQHPYGWTIGEDESENDWLAAQELDCAATFPPICSDQEEYLYGAHGTPEQCEMRQRTIPLLDEACVPVATLSETHTLEWQRPIEEYFDLLAPKAYEATGDVAIRSESAGAWSLTLNGKRSAALTFELAEQTVGFPFFTIEAAEGTTVELLVQEAHASDGPVLLNTHFHSWSRFICREGVNTFETFDYESARWLQLHIHGPAGNVIVRDVGLRRRRFPWPSEPTIEINGEPELQRLMSAAVNTLHNSCQDVCVDGMARERQQYSGDCGHQLLAVYQAFGEYRLPGRFLTTYSQGMTVDGYFLDCWPAYDRMARVATRQVGLAEWGPILDHGVGFNFDCYHHYMYSGNLDALREPFPRLQRFVQYLSNLIADDGLLPVEDIGIPIVWMDHIAYSQQRHKQCAFNLYTAAMLRNAHAPLCRAFGQEEIAQQAEALAARLLSKSVERFWSEAHGAFVANLPWLTEERSPRYCDRSLATSILFDQCPANVTARAVELLANVPDEMGLSYPANAGWRLWALAKAGRTDVVLDDLRQRWATMDSVRLNNTLQEDWFAKPDSYQQWSHCAVAPLYTLYMNIAGIKPTAPGFAKCEIAPQLGTLEHLDIIHHTPRGPIRLHAKGSQGDRQYEITLPPDCQADLIVSSNEALPLARNDNGSYALPSGQTTRFNARSF